MLNIIELLSSDGYIVCNKKLIKMFGADCAILMGELCSEYIYYSSRGELKDGMFYSTHENIEDNTGINEYYQRKAFNTLKEAGILEIVRKDTPAKNYYRIVESKLLSLFTSSSEELKELDVKPLQSNNNKQKITNTLSKDKVGSTPSFEFGKGVVQNKKVTNDEELQNAYLLVDSFTSDRELNSKLKELFRNKKDMCGNNRQHFYATTCKHYLDDLVKVNDKLGAVNLSLQYNNTFKVMEPSRPTYNNSPDTNTHIQKKSDDSMLARDENGNPIEF